MSLLRPENFEEVVGQERAVKSLISKMSSPYPQHIILYGPPGVGKTSAARLALEEAKKLRFTPFDEESQFIEVDGTTLRWEPREITNPLLGSVHDPIYQGSKRDVAEVGVPEPKTGLVTEAHGGVLFIDEIGELDDILQNKLLKVLEDKRVEIHTPAKAKELGIGLLPEDRQLQGLILDWGIGDNITLSELEKYSKNGICIVTKDREVAKELAESVDTKANTLADKASTLSCGNQQKVVVAKILASSLKVIILDEPTKGVDVGAKAEIYEIMGNLAKQGYAIIMISSEMPEILGMCDRIVVMCNGKITGELNRKAASQEKILEFAMDKVAKNENYKEEEKI